MTRANLGTTLPVQSHLAATFAADTAPVSLADALPSGGVTSQRILQVAITALRTVLSKPARFALLFALFPTPPGRTRTLTVDRIADSAVRAVATLRTIFAVAMRITGTITPDSLPARSAEALAGFGCARGPILTLASFTAVLAVRSVVALLFADFSLEAGNAIAGAVDVIAGRIVFAIAVDRTVLAVLQERARSIARRATPSRLAKALSGPGVTHLGVADVAFALFGATVPVPIVGTDPHAAVRSGPAGQTRTFSRGRIALGFVEAPALFRAVDPVRIARTRVQTLGTHKTRRANTLPGHVIAVRTVEAFTLFRAILAVPLALAPIRTHRSRITGRTNALTRLRVAISSVLAATIRLTLVAMFTLRTLLSTQRSGEARCAVTLAGHGIALAPVQALAHLGTVLAEAIGWALELTRRAPVTLRTATAAVLGVTGGVVLALAHLRTVRAPAIRWTVYIARLSDVSLVTAARFRRNALAVPTSGIANRLAPVEFLVLRISRAALFQDPLLVDAGGFVDNLRPHSVRRTPRRNGHAPLLVPLLVGDLPGGRHKHLVLLDLFADVRAFQIVIHYQLIQLGCSQGGRQDHNQAERSSVHQSYASHFVDSIKNSTQTLH